MYILPRSPARWRLLRLGDDASDMKAAGCVPSPSRRQGVVAGVQQENAMGSSSRSSHDQLRFLSLAYPCRCSAVRLKVSLAQRATDGHVCLLRALIVWPQHLVKI